MVQQVGESIPVNIEYVDPVRPDRLGTNDINANQEKDIDVPRPEKK